MIVGILLVVLLLVTLLAGVPIGVSIGRYRFGYIRIGIPYAGRYQ